MTFRHAPLRGEANPAAKLTDKQVTEIRDRYETRLLLWAQAKRKKREWQRLMREAKRHTIDTLALDYGVSRTTIININSRKYRDDAL